MLTIEPGSPSRAFVDSVCQAMGEVFSQELSSSWSTEVSSEEAAESKDDSHLCFALSASGSVRGSAAIQIGNADALLLAQKLLSVSSGAISELDNSSKEAVEKLLRKVAGVAATAMKSRFGELQLHVELSTVSSWPGGTVVLVVSEASAAKMTIQLRLSKEIMESLSDVQAGPKVEEAKNRKLESLPKEVQDSLARVLRVNLGLSLRFGQRSLTLREILDLNSGAVIELDRQVREPADLLLGERLIARGEVIIVDGNYGIRITEVVGD
jgi:flagellar motor switch protein FliN